MKEIRQNVKELWRKYELLLLMTRTFQERLLGEIPSLRASSIDGESSKFFQVQGLHGGRKAYVQGRGWNFSKSQRLYRGRKKAYIERNMKEYEGNMKKIL